MTRILKFCTLLVLLCYTRVTFAQGGTDWLENTMFQSGKINVVVSVMAVLFIVLFVYLFRIDRRLKKIEEEEKN